MKSPYLFPLASIFFASLPALLPACEVKINNDPAFTKSPSLKIKSVAVDYVKDLDLMVFSMNLDGPAGKTVPKAVGQLDGAPVMALSLIHI